MKTLQVIGLNSGTSLDGIDAALFAIAPDVSLSNAPEFIPALKIELLASQLYPIEPPFKHRLKTSLIQGPSGWEEVCRLNIALGETFAAAALKLLHEHNLSREDVDLIGSHGQTIWHCPRQRWFAGTLTRGSIQLGEPAIIAARTGVPVVGDFRAQDLALGGQGAPLVSFADQVLFWKLKQPLGVLNLGGIANLTIIGKSGEALCAFDTGPGNLLINYACEKLLQQEFDYQGQVAAAGKVNQLWLKQLLDHPYFKLAPPKTTGREEFGSVLGDELLKQGDELGLSNNDCLATLTALTAASISRAYEEFVLPYTRLNLLILGGGGAQNATLRQLLLAYWPHKIELRCHEDFGISSKFKESLLFALLAYTTYFGIPNNVPTCTGATRHTCLGKLSLP